MKPIYCILICCLLGLVGCSKADCVCNVTEVRAGVVVGTYVTTEKVPVQISGVSRDDCPRSEYAEVYLTDSLGSYIDYDRINCTLD